MNTFTSRGGEEGGKWVHHEDKAKLRRLKLSHETIRKMRGERQRRKRKLLNGDTVNRERERERAVK